MPRYEVNVQLMLRVERLVFVDAPDEKTARDAVRNHIEDNEELRMFSIRMPQYDDSGWHIRTTTPLVVWAEKRK